MINNDILGYEIKMNANEIVKYEIECLENNTSQLKIHYNATFEIKK
jgi:hypothetical protein